MERGTYERRASVPLCMCWSNGPQEACRTFTIPSSFFRRSLSFVTRNPMSRRQSGHSGCRSSLPASYNSAFVLTQRLNDLARVNTSYVFNLYFSVTVRPVHSPPSMSSSSSAAMSSSFCKIFSFSEVALNVLVGCQSMLSCALVSKTFLSLCFSSLLVPKAGLRWTRCPSVLEALSASRIVYLATIAHRDIGRCLHMS
jgi:hypothetical protein